jgi:outer membrane lipoprotein SlyB
MPNVGVVPNKENTLMDNTARSALHPLLTVAAIAITVFSAVGVATLTGMIPASRGTPKGDPPQVQLAERAAPAPAPTVETPKPKPVVKKRIAPRPPAQEPIYREAGQAPIVEAAPVFEAPKPVVQPGVLGVVESVNEVREAGEAKGLGVVAGGVAGAVLGHQVGSGRGNKLATILGAVGGAVAGNHVEKQARAEKRWDVTVRLDDGITQTLSTPTQPFWNAGDRVRLHDGKLLPV